MSRQGNLTFLELEEASQRLASAWNLGETPIQNHHIAIAVDDAFFLTAFLAVWHLGGVVLPYRTATIDEDLELGRLMAERSHAVFSLGTLPAAFKSLARLEAKDHPLSTPNPALEHRDQWQSIFFTSGTTNKPKAVVRGWRQALFEAKSYSNVLKLEAGAICDMLVSPMFGASTKHLLGCLLSGCTQRFPLLDGLPPQKGSLIYGAPSQFMGFRPIHTLDAGYDRISLTGEPSSNSTWEAMRSIASHEAIVLNAYGGTEFGVAANQLGPLGESPLDFKGSVLQGKNITIVDEAHQPLPKGTPGRVVIASPFLAEGYLESSNTPPTLTPFLDPQGDSGAVITEDIGYLNDEGQLILIGRAGHLIKHHGQWLDIRPLIGFLKQQKTVTASLVTVDKNKGHLIAWVEISHPDEAIMDDLSSRCEDHFCQSPLLPGELHGLSVFPRNRHGKIDYAALTETSQRMTRIPGEDRLDRIARFLLWISTDLLEASKSRSLRDLGLDSIDIYDLMNHLRDRYGTSVGSGLLMSDIPLFKLRQQLERGASHRGFEELGSRDAPETLIWFGYGGLQAIVDHVGDRYRILYIDCDLSLPQFDGHWPCLSEICAHHLERLDPFKAKSRVIMGGFSFGALAAHESARQLAAKGTVINRAILVDPPPVHHSPWTYFNHGVKRRMFEAIHLWQSLQRGHSSRPQAKGDAARRKAMRRHAIQYLEVLESPVETTLFSSMTLEKEHRSVFDGSKAFFLQRVEIPIRDHIAVITAKEAQSIWLKAFLQDSDV
ncbi:MAG: hypothetical protein EBS79_02125 [Gammaproteobacteria bacterium]|nr:hypothetical protein [Gammaproteobacteria bacterium]